MNIKIVCIGKLKKDYWGSASADYEARLKKYCKLSIVELPNIPEPDNASPAECETAKNKEGELILKSIKDSDYVVTMEIKGKMLSSEELAEKINKLGIDGVSDIVFVIGGSLGLSDAVCKRSDFALSFSRMTFPHKLFRILLMEQIYRGFKIINHEPYHK